MDGVVQRLQEEEKGMTILCSHNCMVTRLIVIRISALCFQRRHLSGLRVIHRGDDCSSLRAMYYTYLRMKISRNPKSSEASFHEQPRNSILRL